MDVEEYVLLGRIPHKGRLQFIESKDDMRIAKDCMKLTDTLKVKDHPMDKISGGERQLALIARALTQEPGLLLLDEPMTHLDISHQVKVLDLIKRLNKEMGLTVVMVLHDLNLASEYCHRLALLNNGRIRKIGAPEEVIDYKIIEEVYKTVVVIKKNPISSRPYLFVVSEEERNKERK
jgi:iron complex transport system ATP-binding protein